MTAEILVIPGCWWLEEFIRSSCYFLRKCGHSVTLISDIPVERIEDYDLVIFFADYTDNVGKVEEVTKPIPLLVIPYLTRQIPEMKLTGTGEVVPFEGCSGKDLIAVVDRLLSPH